MAIFKKGGYTQPQGPENPVPSSQRPLAPIEGTRMCPSCNAEVYPSDIVECGKHGVEYCDACGGCWACKDHANSTLQI